jgi:hypothetical protein
VFFSLAVISEVDCWPSEYNENDILRVVVLVDVCVAFSLLKERFLNWPTTNDIKEMKEKQNTLDMSTNLMSKIIIV